MAETSTIRLWNRLNVLEWGNVCSQSEASLLSSYHNPFMKRSVMPKRVVIIGLNFYPEDTAIGLYSTQMAQYLRRNYEVDVITGFPYYPEWKIREEYVGRKTYLEEEVKGIRILRYKEYVPEVPTFKKRILHLVDFMFGSMINLFKIKECDLVICVVPFTGSIVLGYLLAKMKGARLWTHVQDFEFDAAIESGLTGEKSRLKSGVFSLLFRLEKLLFNRSDIVSSISYSMLEKVKCKTHRAEYYFPNWIDASFADCNVEEKHPFLANGKFNILYSGNIGEKQDWDFFIEVIKYFQNVNAIHFVIVGAGATKNRLMELTEEFDNVSFFMPVPFSNLPLLLASADVHILFQKNNVVDTVMPSKLLGMMASRRPSVVTGNLASESAKIFELSKGGFFFDSSDFKGLVGAIETLYHNEAERHSIGENAYKYVMGTFSGENVLGQFGQRVKALLDCRD